MLQSFIIAIVIPDVQVIKRWAMEHGMPGTLSDLCESEEVKRFILEDLAVWAKEAGLKSFEQVTEYISYSQTLVYYLITNVNSFTNFWLGERYLFTSRTIFRTKWLTYTNFQIQETSAEILFQTPDRGYV